MPSTKKNGIRACTERETRYRLIRKDGTLNIAVSNRVSLNDLYHDLLKITWRVFLAIWAAVYFVTNFLFGLIYFLLPAEQFDGFPAQDTFHHFLQSFFFSVQTFGTIGYGKVSPIGVAANFVVTFESLLSLFLVALMTGIIFSRFARPSAKVVFSYHAVTRKFNGVTSLMFRIANSRQNSITDARVRLTLAIDEVETDFRTFIDLELERDSSPIFALSWTIVHDINERSPLKNISWDDLCDRNGEFIVTFSGIDSTLAQTMYAKYSYIAEEILEDHDFVDVIELTPEGSVELHLDRISDVVPVEG